MEPPSPASELTMDDIGAGSSLLTGVIDAQVGPMINLIDQLRAVGIEKDIQIPQIAVMGDQSSGKSSVLEALSGIPFPRGSGLVTKCATELRMKKTPGTAWQASISLSWGQKQPSMAGEVESPEELGEKISSLTEAMLLARGGNATFEAEHSIVIELAAPNVPDLTVIDLPGIVRTQVKGQSSAVMAEVDSLLDRYLKQERTIILCVIPSNVDIATVDILERASKADPTGARTIGVLTKPDTIGEGNEEEVLQVVQGLRKPLKLGYLMVKNRSQKQIDEDVTLMDARELEKSFFTSHAQFGTADPSFFGVVNLMSRLTGVLVSRIQDGLPTMRKEISELKEKTIVELNDMGKPPPTDASSMRAVTLQLAQEVTTMMNEATRGEYSSSIFAHASMRLMARIREEGGPQDTFRKTIITLKPTDEWEVDTLRKSIASMRGRELPGFLNFKVFDMLLKQVVATWKNPALTMLQDVKSIVEEVCEEIVEVTVPQYRTMASGMKQIMHTIIDERAEDVRSTVIEQWVGVESAAFTLQVEFFEMYNKKKVERFAQAYDKMAPDLSAIFQEGNGTELARARMLQWYEQTHSVGNVTNEHHEAEDMQMLLESYWKTACDRAVDSICMKVDQHLIQKLADKTLEVLINLSLDEGKIGAFFAQDPRVREKRVKLQARLDRLKKAQALISNSV